MYKENFKGNYLKFTVLLKEFGTIKERSLLRKELFSPLAALLTILNSISSRT
jgi:hypothetical protein